jgi:hypothetical protein
MHVKHASPIEYTLQSHHEIILLNDYLNKKIKFEFLGDIHCIQCDRKTKQSFQQGFCFPCMQKINECNNCMIHPERCLVETGKCDATSWAHQQCHQEHVVYLANSSGLKVGITRTKNRPSRWIDQGAAQALPIFHTQNRYQAGLIEVALKNFVADKTNWRAMLKEDRSHIDLLSEKKLLLSQAEKTLMPIFEKYRDAVTEIKESALQIFQYPVIQYPSKITTLSFEKTPSIEGVLLGIKGQYLLLDNGVLNIRKFGGYHVIFCA